MSNDTTTVQDVQQAQFRAYTPPTETGHRYNVQLTVNGATAAKLVTAIEQFTAVLDAGGWAPAYGFEGPNGQGACTNGHAAPVGNGGGQTAGTGDGGVTYTARYVVQPEIKGGKPTGKTILEFWNDDRKFSEHRVVASPARVTALIGLPEDAQGTLTTFEQPCKVMWTWGKERPPKEDGSPGGRYQDVQRVELIAPA